MSTPAPWQPVGTCGTCGHPVAQHRSSGCSREGCTCTVDPGIAGWAR